MNTNKKTINLILSFLLFTTIMLGMSWKAKAQVPTITSFSPISGAAGSSVIIAGTNFNITAANNTVFFGATKATVTNASATSLTVTVPFGATYGPITVINTGITSPLACRSFRSFTPRLSTTTTINASAFNPNVTVSTGGSTGTWAEAFGHILSADFDLDGKADMAVPSGNTVLIFRNISTAGGSIAFSLVTTVTASSNLQTVISNGTTTDFDGDGKLDLVVPNRYSGTTISVFRNTSTGTGNFSFAAKQDFTVQFASPYAVAFGDLNRDGKQDMVVGSDNSTGNTFSIFYNNGSVGNISFVRDDISIPLTGSVFGLAVVDFNNDNALDIAVNTAGVYPTGGVPLVVYKNNNSLSVIAGASPAVNRTSFTQGTTPFGTSTNVSGRLNFADFDGDGYVDLALQNFSGVSIFRNTSNVSTISFAAQQNYFPNNNNTNFEIGDLNNDGLPDLAISSANSTGFDLYTNTSTSGTISLATPPIRYTTMANITSVKMGDFNNDGTSDIITSNSVTPGTFIILQNGINSWKGTNSIDWSTGTNWSSGSVPTSTDYVVVPSGTTNSPTISSAAVCGTLDIALGATLTINLTNTLTISNNINNAGSIIANASTISVGGTFTNSGTFTAGTGTVNYTGAAQTAAVLTYNNLTLSGSGAKTFATNPTVNGILSLEGTASVMVTGGTSVVTYGANATLQYNKPAAYTATIEEWITPFTASGGIIIRNTGAITLPGAVQIGNNTNVPLNINSGAILTPGANLITLHGDFINAGTLTSGSGGITIAGTVTAQNIAGFTTTGTVSMTKTAGTATFTGNVNGAGFTMNGTGGTLNLGSSLTHTFTGTWTRTDGTLNANTSTLNLSGSISGTGGIFTAGTGTVNYIGAAQTAAVLTYNNLTISGTGAKTFATSPTVNGILSMEGTTAAITVTTGVVTYGANATLQYNKGANNYTATSEEWITPFTASGGVVIKGTGIITLNTAKVMNQLSIESGARVDLGAFSSLTRNLLLANSPQSLGSYGGTSSAATNKNATYFPNATTGILTETLFPFWTGAVSSNWHTIGNWADNIIPISTDYVVIPGYTVNQPTISATAVCNNLDIASGASLTFSGSNALTVGTNLTNVGTITANAGTIAIGGIFSNSGTFTAGTGTVNYTGAAQTVVPITYNNLTLSGSGVKTTTTVTVNGVLSMEGTATVSVVPTYGSAATLQYNTATARTAGVEWPSTFVATGGVIIANTGVITLNAAKVFGSSTVPLTINSGATLATANFGLTFHGDFINNGTLTAVASPLIITGTTATQNIGSFITTGAVSMTKTAGIATFTGNINGAVFTINGLGGTLNLGTGLTHLFTSCALTNGTLNGGSSTLSLSATTPFSGTLGNFVVGTGTVELRGAAQTAPVITYNNLILSGSGTKTINAITISTNLSISGTAVASLAGNTNTATLTLGGVGRASGTWGSTSSSATNPTNTYFASTGVVTVSTDNRPILTITAINGSKTYGQTFTTGAGSTNFTSTGLLNGETIGTVTIASTGAVSSAAFGSYTIVPSAATGGTFTASNYTISYSTGTLTVATAPLTVTASAQSKNYGSTSPTTGTLNTHFTVSGLQNSDAASGATLAYSGSPAGNLATAVVGSYFITPSALTLSSGSTSNYSITYGTGTLTVNAATNNWNGGIGNWNTAGNWSLNRVPSTLNDNITVSSGSPTLDINYTLATERTFTISGSGVLIINPTSSLTIAGTADFGGKLVTLKSDATGTASIGQITGTLSNATNLTVERYIPANGRKYRFLAPPVVGGTSLQWRDNAGSTAGRGTHITGPIGTTDVSTTPQASAFKYTESLSSATNINECWEAIDGNTALANGKGYRVFVRGDRSISLTTLNTINNATTLWVNGTYPSGTRNLPVSYTAGKGEGWNLVGNPYPCTIDYEASSGWAKTNMGSGVAIYRPSTNSYAYSLSTGGANPSNLTINGGSQYIASGQAFFVKANGIGTPTLTCTEAVKVTNQGSPINLFKGVPTNQLRLTLTQDSSNIDETLIAFAANYKDAFDNNEDISKIPNANVNLSTVVGTEKYAAINLTSNNYKEKVMPLSVWSNKNGDLQLSFSQLAGFDAGITIFLKDKFLNTTTAIDQDKTINISLADNSKGDNRFELVFKNSNTNIEQFTNSDAQLAVYPNPAVDVLNINISNASFKNSSITITNVSGQELINTNMSGTDKQIIIEGLSNGIYFVNISNDNGFNKTVKFVK